MNNSDITYAIDEIRRLATITDVVSSYVKLIKDGKHSKALCPFHKENTPSFKINIDTNRYKCFGCGKSGDAIGFMMDMENADFMTVIRKLGDKYGVSIAKQDAISLADEPLRILYRIHEEALSYFLNCENPEVASYIKSRNIPDESIRMFDIGASPDMWDGLYTYLRGKKFTECEIVDSGVVVKKEDTGTVYDRFRNRMIIPIRDDLGRVTAFSGRAVTETDNGAKYINSPSTEIFQKGSVLFALDKARSAIRQKKAAIVVEGQIDVISMHRVGFCNTVAPMGTAFTIDHAHILKKYTNKVIFVFDGDTPGIDAATRSIEICIKEGMETLVVFPQEGEDPDKMVNDGKNIEELISAATDGFDWLLSTAVYALPRVKTPWTCFGVVSRFAELALCFDEIFIRDMYLELISKKTGARYEIIKEYCDRVLAGKT